MRTHTVHTHSEQLILLLPRLFQLLFSCSPVLFQPPLDHAWPCDCEFPLHDRFHCLLCGLALFTSFFHNAKGFFHHCFAHPTTTKLARKIQQEQHSMQFLRHQLKLGTRAGKKNKTYIRVNEAIRTMVTDYDNRNPITYLGDIARVLNINVVWCHYSFKFN